MEPRTTTKDVSIGERKYQLSKMDARLACWLFSTLASRIEDGSQLMAALGRFPKEQFDEIQGTALRFVSSIDDSTENRLLSSVVGPNGLWADKVLGSNPSEVFKLTIESILFNIAPFLDVSASTAQQ